MKLEKLPATEFKDVLDLAQQYENILGLLKRKQNQVDVQFLTPIETTGLDRKALAHQAHEAIVKSLPLLRLS